MHLAFRNNFHWSTDVTFLLSLSPFLSDGCSMWNQSDPIIVSLRHTSPGNYPVAAHWSLQALEHHGSWSLDGCQLAHSDASTSTLRCSVLSNYAVLQVTL